MELTTEILEEFRDWSVLQTSSGEVEDFLEYLREKTLARNAQATLNYIAEMRDEVLSGGDLPDALTIENLLNAPFNDPDVNAWLGDVKAKEQLVAESNVGMSNVINLVTKRIVDGKLVVVDDGPEPA